MTYGVKFYLGGEVLSFVSDTRYHDGLLSEYADSTILVLNVVFYERRREYGHLCLEDAEKIIKAIKPKKAVITHFGTTMLRAKPRLIEERLRSSLSLDVKCAYDGYILGF